MVDSHICCKPVVPANENCLPPININSAVFNGTKINKEKWFIIYTNLCNIKSFPPFYTCWPCVRMYLSSLHQHSGFCNFDLPLNWIRITNLSRPISPNTRRTSYTRIKWLISLLIARWFEKLMDNLFDFVFYKLLKIDLWVPRCFTFNELIFSR